MRARIRFLFFGLVVTAVLAGCASGPVVPTPPTVRVTEFRSTLFTPDQVRFHARIVITNQMRASLDFAKVDYGLNLFDKTLLTQSFTGMKKVRSNGTETVTIPMRIPMKEILAQHIAVLAEGKMQFTFRGSVYPSTSSGFGPVPFSRTIEIPLPSIPQVTFAGTSGVPLTQSFRVEIGIRNTNNFPLSVNDISTALDLNGQRYRLLGTQQSTDIPAGGTGTVVLTTETSKTAALSMALNVLENNAVNLKIVGSVTAGTPYGYVFIPVEVEGKSKPK